MNSVVGYLGSLPGGLPHSEIHGSKPVSGSPWLIAAVHVLHRLSSPRHPPRALCILISLPKAHQRPPHPLRCCGPTWRRQARSTYRSTCRSPSLPSGSSRRASDGAPIGDGRHQKRSITFRSQNSMCTVGVVRDLSAPGGAAARSLETRLPNERIDEL